MRTVTSSKPLNPSQFFKHWNGGWIPDDPTQYEMSARRDSSLREPKSSEGISFVWLSTVGARTPARERSTRRKMTVSRKESRNLAEQGIFE